MKALRLFSRVIPMGSFAALLASVVFLASCSETLLRRRPVPAPTLVRSESEVQPDLNAELQRIDAALQGLQASQNQVNQALATRIRSLQTVVEYQNVGLSILAQHDAPDSSVDKKLFDLLSRKGREMRVAETEAAHAMSEADKVLGADWGEYSALRRLLAPQVQAIETGKALNKQRVERSAK